MAADATPVGDAGREVPPEPLVLTPKPGDVMLVRVMADGSLRVDLLGGGPVVPGRLPPTRATVTGGRADCPLHVLPAVTR